MGVLSSIMDIGHSGGPMVAGVLIAAIDYQVAFAAIGGAIVIISILYGLGMGNIAKQAGRETQ